MLWILIAAVLSGLLIALGRKRAPLRKRRAVRRRRERRFEEEGASTCELPDLTLLVDRCLSGGARDPFDLDALLDRYADLAFARHRCKQLLVRADRDSLETRLARARSAQHPRSAAMLERRIAYTAQLGRLGRRIEESLSEVGELVHYYVERSLY